MKSFTIEYIIGETENEFLRLLKNTDQDLQVTYLVDNGRAWVNKVEIFDDIHHSWKDITHACNALEAIEEIREDCEFHFTGMIVKEMFNNYPELAKPVLTAEEKAELLKIK